MNKRNFLQVLIAAASISISTYSYAVIIEGTFAGKVSEAQDGNDFDPSYVDIWDGNIVGEAVTGSFWYDTSLAPANSGNANTGGIYFKRTDWLGISFNVDGKTFDISNDNPSGLPITYRANTITVDDDDLGGDGIVRDRFMIVNSLERGVEGGNINEIESMVGFRTELLDTLNGIGLTQEFELHSDLDSSFSASAFFNIFRRLDGQLSYSSVNIDISDIRAQVRNQVSVPEPSTFILMGVGLLGLILRTKRINA